MSFSQEIFIKFSNRSPAMVERSQFFIILSLEKLCSVVALPTGKVKAIFTIIYKFGNTS